MKLKKVQEKKFIAKTSIYPHQVLYKFQVQKVVHKYKITKEKGKELKEEE